MNHLQEVILDRLAGANEQEIENHAGPVGLALHALSDAHLLGDPPSALGLGYPLIFSRVLEAACAMLETAEEKRQVAITVVAEIAPRVEVVNLAPQQLIEAAVWCARRLHALICRADCPFLQDAIDRVDLYLHNPRNADLDLETSNQQFFACSASTDGIWDELSSSMITLRTISYRSIDAVLQGARADRSQQSPEGASSEGAAYAGRLAAHFQGVQGAAKFCVALARELKL